MYESIMLINVFRFVELIIFLNENNQQIRYLYKLYVSAEGIWSWANLIVSSMDAVAWYDRHSSATFCLAINLPETRIHYYSGAV